MLSYLVLSQEKRHRKILAKSEAQRKDLFNNIRPTLEAMIAKLEVTILKNQIREEITYS